MPRKKKKEEIEEIIKTSEDQEIKEEPKAEESGTAIGY